MVVRKQVRRKRTQLPFDGWPRRGPPASLPGMQPCCSTAAVVFSGVVCFWVLSLFAFRKALARQYALLTPDDGALARLRSH